MHYNDSANTKNIKSVEEPQPARQVPLQQHLHIPQVRRLRVRPQTRPHYLPQQQPRLEYLAEVTPHLPALEQFAEAGQRGLQMLDLHPDALHLGSLLWVLPNDLSLTYESSLAYR